MTRPASPEPAAKAHDQAIGRALVARGRLSETDLRDALGEATRGNRRLAQVLVERGRVGPDEIRDVSRELGSGRIARAPLAPTALEAPPRPPRVPTASGRLRSDSGRLRPRQEAGDLVGRYRLVEQIGRGGMGVVWRAWDPSLAREVAVKLLGGPGSTVTDQHRLRFEREARTAARLRHPGIVTVHEVAHEDDRSWIVMDLVVGASFEARLKSNDLPRRRAVELVREVALALVHAHAEGVVHRDVKPENILVDAEGQARLTDFGLARRLDDDRLTVTGQVLGTPAYMAPEQAGRGDGIGPPADVYATGGVLYRVLTGRPPLDGDLSFAEAMRRILYVPPPPPRSLDASIHPDLETIVLRCLAKEPADRYPSIEALADDLGHFLDGKVIAARPDGRAVRARRWARDNPKAAALAATLATVLLVAAVAGVLVLGAWRRRDASLRAAFAADARRAADTAQAAFDEARARPASTEAADHDELLGLALRAVQTSATLHALAPDDADARRRAFEAAMACGEVARRAEQWSLAASAYDAAGDLEVDALAVGVALRELDDARRARRAGRLAAADAIIAEARRGDLALRPGGRDDAVFELVRIADPVVVARLAAELERVTDDLDGPLREAWVQAATPTAAERAADDSGEVAAAVSAMETALEERLAPLDGGRLGEASREAFEEAGVRLAARVGGRQRKRERSAVLALAARLQEAAVDRERFITARVCCEALGRIGIRAGALRPLGRYVLTEADPLRAVPAGIALCLLGGEDAERILLAARWRFGRSGTFWRQVSRWLDRTGVDTGLEEETAVGYLERAKVRVSKDRNEEAVADLDRAIELEPELAEAWRERGYVRSRLKDYERAIADLSRALELDPDDASAWFHRGYTYGRKNELGASVADMSRCLELDPLYVKAWRYRATANAMRGEDEAAIADFTRALELDPSYAGAWEGRGFSLTKAGDFEGARSDFDRAISLDPRYFKPWGGRAQAREYLGDLEGAVSDLERCVELSEPDDERLDRLKAKIAQLRDQLRRRE